MIVKKVASFQECAICHRTLLLGEKTVRFAPPGSDWVDVCALCTDDAYEHGWVREGHAVCDFPIVEGYEGPQPAPVGTPPPAGPRKGYWIAHVDITDPEGYKAYQAANAKPFGMFGARFLVRGGRQEVMEGRVRARCVIMEFPSYEAALACYRSPEYQAAKALRQGKGEVDLIVHDGYTPGGT